MEQRSERHVLACASGFRLESGLSCALSQSCADRQFGSGISSHELARFVDFVEQFEQETEQALSIKTGYSETRLLATLMRNHLTGKLSTSSSLISSSGLTYGTALRGINSLIERDLIVKRPRTPTGKSFSLYPTTKQLNEGQEWFRRVRSLLGSTLSIDLNQDSGGTDYYYGSSYQTLPRNALIPFGAQSPH